MGKSFYSKYLSKPPETPVLEERGLRGKGSGNYSFSNAGEEIRRASGRGSEKGFQGARKEMSSGKTKGSFSLREEEGRCLEEMHYEMVRAQQHCRQMSRQVDA
jgi:hypothetical protein